MNKYCEIIDRLEKLSSSNIMTNQRYIYERYDDKIYPEMRDIFRKYDVFNEFDCQMQSLEESYFRVNLDYLTDWMIDRARKTSAKNALNEVLTYIENDSFNVNYNIWLSGILVDTELQISENIVLKPVDSFSNVEYSNGRFIPKKTPTACILYSYDHPKKIYNSDQTFKESSISREVDLLLSAMLLIRKRLSVFPFAYSIDVDECVPVFVDYGFRSDFIIRRYLGSQILQIEADNIMDLYNGMRGLKSDRQNEILFLLRLLNQYCSEFDKVTKSVQFRTLIEAIYVGGRSINIAKDIKRNIMKNSGLEGKAKSKLGDRVIKLYNICSQAVHSAHLSSEEIMEYDEHEDFVLDYVYKDLIKLVNGKILDRQITVSTIVEV